MPLSINHYLDHMSMLTNQWTPLNYREKNRQRLYLKDIDCPDLWHEKLKEEIPPGLFYLNESVGEIGGLGALQERNPNGIGTRLGRGVAKAGDLMSCLPPSMRAQNLMCYVGHEGTYTPAHREMCASLGQNIMVETSGPVGEDGKPTKPGSSIWFMTEHKDRHLVSEYWLSALGHDIEVESHFAQINAWKRAPFTVYVVEQKVGDFILIPPLAPHQVWNRGTRTMKVAWNRTTVETLELALNEALPNARMVCRDEQYKNKAIVLFTMNRYSKMLRDVETLKGKASHDERISFGMSPKVRQLEKDFRRLFKSFKQIMISEMFSLAKPKEKCEYVPFDGNVTCSYCRCNIFNRFLTCKACVVPLEDKQEDTYDICLECFVMGRSCKCRSRLTWAEQFPWKDVVEKYEIWRRQVIALQGGQADQGPFPIEVERRNWPEKTLAEICQEQLHLRPFKDVNKEDTPEPEEEENEPPAVAADDSQKKKKPKKRPERWYRENLPCHICVHRHPKWKMATCSCGTSFCYGSLWRGFDLLPQQVMEKFDWKCPKCRRTCSCASCIKNPHNEPYEPKGTILGHDTRKFADPRSAEHLVDFSYSNMYWVKKAGDDLMDGSRRMLRREAEAAEAKSHDEAFDEQYVDDEYPAQSNGVLGTPQEASLPLDPQLGAVFQPNGDSDVMQAAQSALNVMSGLSQLERDPELFIEHAGLGDAQDGNANYEYPDPNGSRPGEQTQDGEAPKPGNKKKKRNRGLQLVQSDAANDVNSKFQLEQAKQSMEEAKRQGRLISVTAAITGQKKIVCLRVPPAALSNIVNRAPVEEPLEVPAEEPQAPPVLVESDLPKEIPAKMAAARNPQVPKKRRRGEIDEDFTNTKEEERRSKATKSAGRKLVSEIPDGEGSEHESEPDLEQMLVAESAKQNAPKRRSLPAYLARRSPVNETELPKELSNAATRKASRVTKPNPQRRPSPVAPMASGALSDDNAALPERSAQTSPSSVVEPTPPAAPAPAAFTPVDSTPANPATTNAVQAASAKVTNGPFLPSSESASKTTTPAQASSPASVQDSRMEFDFEPMQPEEPPHAEPPNSNGSAPVNRDTSLDANRQAKLRALGELDDSDLDFSDDDGHPSPQKPTPKKQPAPPQPRRVPKTVEQQLEESESEDTEDTGMSEDVIEPARRKPLEAPRPPAALAPTSAKRGRGRPPKPTRKSNGIQSSPQESPPKKSIFNKLGPGKARISGRSRS